MNMKNTQKLLVFVLAVLFVSCKSHPLPECITEKTKNLSIRWGEADKKKKVIRGLKIDGTGKIFSFEYQDTSKTLTFSVPANEYKEVGYVDSKWFCDISRTIQDDIIKTQVSNEPGELTEFLEFSNPSVNNYYRGQWVRKFATKNSELFRKAYDSLQTFKLYKEEK